MEFWENAESTRSGYDWSQKVVNSLSVQCVALIICRIPCSHVFLGFSLGNLVHIFLQQHMIINIGETCVLIELTCFSL